jgi:hypothetical protein
MPDLEAQNAESANINRALSDFHAKPLPAPALMTGSSEFP